MNSRRPAQRQADVRDHRGDAVRLPFVTRVLLTAVLDPLGDQLGALDARADRRLEVDANCDSSLSGKNSVPMKRLRNSDTPNTRQDAADRDQAMAQHPAEAARVGVVDAVERAADRAGQAALRLAVAALQPRRGTAAASPSARRRSSSPARTRSSARAA